MTNVYFLVMVSIYSIAHLQIQKTFTAQTNGESAAEKDKIEWSWYGVIIIAKRCSVLLPSVLVWTSILSIIGMVSSF